MAESSFADVAEGAFADDRAQIKPGKRQVLRNGGRGRIDVEAEAGVRLKASEVLAAELRWLNLVCRRRHLRVRSAEEGI